MKPHKIYVAVEDSTSPFLRWEYVKPPAFGEHPGGYSGCIPLRDITLDKAVVKMIAGLRDRPELQGDLEFEIGYHPDVRYLQEGIKQWKVLEKEGYPRVSKEQKEKLMSLIKEYYKPGKGEEK
ncbi:MAG: hypothetical protein KKF46_06215 [Nanoarchaeota archaeon]|nr:hypothetical protein [Nanoarchaeota archaeon]MBU1321926.1 hypothetical protein [Nanoarchaeota archaeon]MBU1597619.1 hypothetical protein [Nanoarchaeota archaeon]MBU2440987.1 hypothetical protein [Nanoarchaeota archaeon]